MRIKIKRGDTVEVIAGTQKGTQGEVTKVFPEEGRVVVQGVNVRKKHQRQVQAGGRTMSPGIIHFEAPVNISNVMVVCPSCSKPSRLGITREDGEPHRVCKNCESTLE